MPHESQATIDVRVLGLPQVYDLIRSVTAVVAAAEQVLAQQHPEFYSQEEVELSEAVVGLRYAVARVFSSSEPPHPHLPEWLGYKLPGARP